MIPKSVIPRRVRESRSPAGSKIKRTPEPTSASIFTAQCCDARGSQSPHAAAHCRARPIRGWLGALALVAAACAADVQPSEPWMAPRPAGGKADEIVMIRGADVPSRHADDAATYLHDRSLWALREVGALEGVRSSVASRADGIIDALPADGRLDIEELVRLEESPYFDLLFPEEQDALPSLWPLLEIPDSDTHSVDFSDLEPLAVEERSVEPELTLPDWLRIDEFSVGLRDALRRMQLGFNDDGDRDTVSLADIDGALANPGAFTPAEIAAIERARAEFLPPRHIDALRANRATHTRSAEHHDSGWRVHLREQHAATTIAETRSETVWHRRSSQSYRVSIELRRQSANRLRLQDGQQVIVIERQHERDQVLDNSAATVSAGDYWVELWEGGHRIATMWASLPALETAAERLDISEYVGHRFETSDGVELVRNLSSTRSGNSNWYVSRTINYSWDLEIAAPTGTVDRSVEARCNCLAPRSCLATTKPPTTTANLSPSMSFRRGPFEPPTWGTPAGSASIATAPARNGQGDLARKPVPARSTFRQRRTGYKPGRTSVLPTTT